jgi:acetyltransferase-like isoleucine patch superfamily enzyme
VRKLDRDSFPHVLYYALRGARRRVSTVYCYWLARWWGVSLGKGCWFDGAILFNRHPRSSITIGNNCGFSSQCKANLGGINRPCMISTIREGATLRIGERCGFSGTVIGCQESITIGENLRCATNTLIFDTDWHTYDSRSGGPAPVVIGNNVWLGINVHVLKGVTIGDGTLVGANSLVTKSLPGGVIAAGSPARVVKRVDE